MPNWTFPLAFLLAALAQAAGAWGQSINTRADYAVIYDQATEEVLWGKNADTPMVPASMTKIMTAYLVVERIKDGTLSYDTEFTVSEDAWRRGGWPSGTSTMGLAPGSRVAVRELLNGLVIMSGNDAAIVLAEGISGSETAFAEEMTALAQRKGLESLTFKNATGLEAEGHLVSAADLARLASMMIRDHPEFYETYSTPSFTWGTYTQANRNPVLGVVEGADGLKTGFLQESGYGLTASAERDGIRRVIVINGPSLDSVRTRAAEAERMMRIAFNGFDTRILEPGMGELPELPLYLAAKDTLAVRLAEPATITAQRSAFDEAEVRLQYDSPLRGAVEEGDSVGLLLVELPGKPLLSVDVVAAETVAGAGFFGRVIAGMEAVLTPGRAAPEDGGARTAP